MRVRAHLPSGSSAFWIGLLLVHCSIAGAQETEAAAGVDAEQEAQAPALPTERPSFLLPDIVVEGEDLSHMGGGIRLLETSVPSVRPQQEPQLVSPGPSEYIHRSRSPLLVRLPGHARSARWRGFLHAEGASAPGGDLSGVLLPGSGGNQLLWGRAMAIRDRLPNARRMLGSLGWIVQDSPILPRTRLSVGADLQLDLTPGPPAAGEQEDLRSEFVHARLDLEHRIALGDHALTVSVMPFHLAGTAEMPGVGSDTTAAPRKEHRATWSGLGLRLTSAGGLFDRRALLNEEGTRSFGYAIARPALRVEYDVSGELVRAESRWNSTPTTPDLVPADSNRTHLRAAGRLGASLSIGFGRLALGLAGGAEGRETLLGPWASWVCHSPWLGAHWNVLVAPAVSFAEQQLGAGELLTLGDAPDREALPILFRAGLSADGSPVVPWRARISRRPASSIVDPMLPMQRAWPRLLGQMDLTRERTTVRIGLGAAKLEDVHEWRALPDSVGPGSYVLEAGEERWLARVECSCSWGISSIFELHWAYAGTWDEAPGDRSLAFLPGHDLQIMAGRGRAGLMWGVGVHLRDRAPLQGDGFADLQALMGWSFSTGRLYLRADNLLGDDVVLLPGEGRDGAEVRLIWDQAFRQRLP